MWLVIGLLAPFCVAAIVAYFYVAGGLRFRLRYGRPVSTWPDSSACAKCGTATVTALRNDGQEDMPICPECLGVTVAASGLEYRIPPRGERNYTPEDLRWVSRTARDYVKQEDDNG